MKELVAEKTRELELTQEVTIDSLASLAEYRDPETGGHIMRTKQYIKILAQHIQHKPGYKEFLNDQTIKHLYLSAPLHDIGKVGVKDSILLKPGKLTVSEFEAMKLHTKYGRDAIMVAEKKLGSASFLRYAREIAYTHHEKWDGSGYPENLSGEDIPVIGRLMALADVYDALISKRVYKPPFPHKKAISIISEGKGKHFDPEMVDAFLELQDAFRQIAIRFADFDEEKKMLMAD
jgi:putative two-component system response regulator